MQYLGSLLIEHLREGVYVYDATSDQITTVYQIDYNYVKLDNGTSLYSVKGDSEISNYGIFLVPKYEVIEYMDKFPEEFL